MFTSVMGTEFFTLCLIRKREKRERGVKKTEECSESEAMFVCVLHQLVAPQINKLLNTTLFIIFLLVFL